MEPQNDNDPSKDTFSDDTTRVVDLNKDRDVNRSKKFKRIKLCNSQSEIHKHGKKTRYSKTNGKTDLSTTKPITEEQDIEKMIFRNANLPSKENSVSERNFTRTFSKPILLQPRHAKEKPSLKPESKTTARKNFNIPRLDLDKLKAKPKPRVNPHAKIIHDESTEGSPWVEYRKL